MKEKILHAELLEGNHAVSLTLVTLLNARGGVRSYLSVNVRGRSIMTTRNYKSALETYGNVRDERMAPRHP